MQPTSQLSVAQFIATVSVFGPVLATASMTVNGALSRCAIAGPCNYTYVVACPGAPTYTRTTTPGPNGQLASNAIAVSTGKGGGSNINLLLFPAGGTCVANLTLTDTRGAQTTGSTTFRASGCLWQALLLRMGLRSHAMHI